MLDHITRVAEARVWIDALNKILPPETARHRETHQEVSPSREAYLSLNPFFLA